MPGAAALAPGDAPMTRAAHRLANEPNVYERLGVRTIINASGPSTRLSGGIMHPEVADAMREASGWCVDIAELQSKASEIIAEATGAEAGYVTAGAAAALMLGTAACVTGLDPAKMNRLPDTAGMKNEVVMARSQRNMYDHAVQQAGCKLIEVGIPDRFSGAGVRDAQLWEYEAAITERTVAFLWVAQAQSEPSLKELTSLAQRHGLPVIVDAAGQLPPVENLKRFIAEGADLVAYSGGKAIGGPQASGILAGRRELVQAAALQHLDHDTYFDQWSPPKGLFEKDRIVGLPASGIGRPAKVGKEEIVGLLTALKLFVAEDPEVRRKRWLGLAQELMDALKGIAMTELTLKDDNRRRGLPVVELKLDEAALGISARVLVKRLQDGNPSVHANHARVREGMLLFGPMCLKPGEAAVVGHRVREELKRA
jgi:L-seryl-tRNA(Ser) seleniumtransferase